MVRQSTEKFTNPIDIAFLLLFGLVMAVTAWALFGAGPDSWFHTHRNQAFALLFSALGVLGILELINASRYGKIWVKLSPIYQHEHPRVFALQKGMDTVMLMACVVGIVAVLFFLPPL
jgi:hypothetical protein